jgi:hypothetical protein
MTGDLSAAIAHAFRRIALPLAVYYSVTVGIPLANGAGQSGAMFMRHTLVVLIVPPLVVVLVCTAHMLARAPKRKRKSSTLACSASSREIS